MTIRNRLVILVCLMFLGLYAPSAYADNVILTSGSVTTFSGVATVNLTGPDFSLKYFGEVVPGSPSTFGMNSVTNSLGLAIVTFNGVTSGFFTGGISFTDSSITGSVTAYNSMDDQFFHINPIFSVTFSGTGFLTITTPGGFTQRQFTVTANVPEPTTLLQLFAGLTSGGAIVFRRYRPKRN